MTLVIDHVVLAVHDLEDAGERLLRDHGLVSVPGGRHARWGTANRVVPLGDDYIELIGVVDPDQATGTVFGRTMLELPADGDRWFAICLASDDVDAIARRLELAVEPGSRTRPDGAELRWRGAGLESPERDPWLPFFITWDTPPELHPGRTSADHPSGADGIAWLELGGDQSRLSDWLGDADLPIRVVDGGPGLRAVSLRTAGGVELILR
ncbi:MAG: VOC family protein [Actinomycetota bacterium]